MKSIPLLQKLTLKRNLLGGSYLVSLSGLQTLLEMISRAARKYWEKRNVCLSSKKSLMISPSFLQLDL